MLGGGVLLALVVGLSIWIGKLRSQVREGEALLAELTLQRDAAVETAKTAFAEAKAAGLEADKHAALAAKAFNDRKALEERLARSRRDNALLRPPKNYPECMQNLSVQGRHISLLEKTLRAKSTELRYTKETLAIREYQVSQLNGAVVNYQDALRLEGARLRAMELVQKRKRKKRIVGITFGVVGALALGGAAGWAIAQ